MKKKLLSFTFAICLIVCCAFTLSACGNGDCNHQFMNVTKIPTFNDAGECCCLNCSKTITLPKFNTVDYNKNDNPDYEVYTYTVNENTEFNFCAKSNFQMNNDNGYFTVTGYTGNNTSIKIPATVYEYKDYQTYWAIIPRNLERIDDFAFKDNASITSVSFEEGVNGIGMSAFEGCTSLTEISLSNSVSYIGTSAFQNTALEELVIPDSVKDIGCILNGCNSLRKLTLPKVYGNFYNLFGTGIVQSSLSDVPASLKEVVLTEKSCDFSGCDKIEKITVLGGTETGLYSGCTSLKEITLSPSVTAIGENTFENCSALTDIVIPASVTAITVRNGALEDCGDVNLYYLGSKTNINVNDEDDTVNIYYYSDTAPNGVEYLNNKKVIETWHYNADNQRILWQPNFTTNVNGKAFNYSNSTVKFSDTYWAMLKGAERQGVLGELFDNDQDRINEVTSSNTKEEYESKMAVYYASMAGATSVSFANGKISATTSIGAIEIDYIEVDGKVCCKLSGGNQVWFTYENGSVYEEAISEHYAIRHFYVLAD